MPNLPVLHEDCPVCGLDVAEHTDIPCPYCSDGMENLGEVYFCPTCLCERQRAYSIGDKLTNKFTRRKATILNVLHPEDPDANTWLVIQEDTGWVGIVREGDYS